MNISIIYGPAAHHGFWGLLTQPALATAVVAFIGVLITVIVGTSANFRLAKSRNKFERDLAQKRFDLDSQLATQKIDDEKAARIAARIENARLRSNEFQRITLLELQVSILELLRATADAQIEHATNAIKSDGWGDIELSDELSERSRQLQAKTILLQSRTHDNNIREMVSALKSHCSQSAHAKDENECRTQINAATMLFDKFNEEVGKILRHLDYGDRN